MIFYCSLKIIVNDIVRLSCDQGGVQLGGMEGGREREREMYNLLQICISSVNLHTVLSRVSTDLAVHFSNVNVQL